MRHGAERRAAGAPRAPVRQTVARRALLRTRVDRERLIIKLRGFAFVFSLIQSAIERGDSAALTWILVAVLGFDWLLTSELLRRNPARNHRVVGGVGMALDVCVTGAVLANNRSDPGDPIFLIVLFVSLEAALRWGRWGGIAGGLGGGLMSSVWGWTVFDDGAVFEHATMRFFVIAIVGGITGGLVHRLDFERTRLAELAYTDALTGLASRSALQEELALDLERGATPALVYLDLDGFKAINDRLGHSVGDALLAGIGTRMRSAVRDADLVARLGGDEFVVVVAGGDAVALSDLLERLRPAVTAPVAIGGRTVSVGVSLGTVVAEPGDTVDSLLRRADDAMYRAKRAGRAG